MKKYYAAALILILAFLVTLRVLSPNNSPWLPNVKITPGAIDPRVTQANIASTICVVGYTATVRPVVSYTNNLKRTQLDSGYRYGNDTNLQDYEEDHLIPLEVGGNPNSPLNLWPEYLYGSYGAHIKDQLEDEMHYLVCHGKISLKAAQAAFTPNWILGYQKYVKGGTTSN
jgi:hypothetical protein